MGQAVITRFRTRKTGVLFGFLAYHSERSHPREMLAELLWPEARGNASRNSLSQALSSLRHELSRSEQPIDEVLLADRATVQLHGNTDVAAFVQAVKTEGTQERRLEALVRGTALYRGELLPGHYDDWILAERSRLRDLFLQANHELVTLLRRVGDLRGAISAAHRGVREDSLSEAAMRDLMVAHFEAREPQLALRAYHELEANLEREVGTRPSSETRALARDIATATSSDAAPVALRAPATTATCVMVQLQRAEQPSPAVWTAAAASVRALIKNELTSRGGQIVHDGASSIVGSFSHPVDGLDSAVQIREEVRRRSWPDGTSIDARIGIDTFLLQAGGLGEVDIHSMAESLRAGEIVLSESTVGLVRRNLEPGLRIAELGPRRLNEAPERFYRLELTPALAQVGGE